MQFGTSSRRVSNSEPKIYHLDKWDDLDDPQRLEIIKEIIEGEGRDPSIAELTVNILKQAGVAPRDYEKQSAALLKWVQENIYYVNEPGERLQSPKYTLRRGFGDCDDMVIVLCSFFESIGLPWKLVLSGTNHGRKMRYIQGEPYQRGTEWTHIYCMVGNQPFHPTNWFFCEPTIKNVPLGWDVVAAKGNHLPELLAPQYGGSLTTGLASGLAADHNGQTGSLLDHVTKVSISVVIGVTTAIATELLLEYIKERREEKKQEAV